MGLMTGTATREARTEFVRAPSAPRDLGHTAAAVALAQDMAAALNITVEVTWWSLCNAPGSLERLLRTPEGWTTLSRHIADDLGFGPVDYKPQVH